MRLCVGRISLVTCLRRTRQTVGKHASVRAWAVAGRNRGRLDEVAQSLERQGSRPDVVVADVRDPASVEAMARSCRLLLNCVGPYRFFGEPVVRACAENGAGAAARRGSSTRISPPFPGPGTHYLDISGEPLFIESMALKYDEAAKESGAVRDGPRALATATAAHACAQLIVSACGGDSVPADLGTVFAERQFGDNALVNRCAPRLLAWCMPLPAGLTYPPQCGQLHDAAPAARPVAARPLRHVRVRGARLRHAQGAGPRAPRPAAARAAAGGPAAASPRRRFLRPPRPRLRVPLPRLRRQRGAGQPGGQGGAGDRGGRPAPDRAVRGLLLRRVLDHGGPRLRRRPRVQRAGPVRAGPPPPPQGTSSLTPPRQPRGWARPLPGLVVPSVPPPVLPGRVLARGPGPRGPERRLLHLPPPRPRLLAPGAAGCAAGRATGPAAPRGGGQRGGAGQGGGGAHPRPRVRVRGHPDLPRRSGLLPAGGQGAHGQMPTSPLPRLGV